MSAEMNGMVLVTREYGRRGGEVIIHVPPSLLSCLFVVLVGQLVPVTGVDDFASLLPFGWPLSANDRGLAILPPCCPLVGQSMLVTGVGDFASVVLWLANASGRGW